MARQRLPIYCMPRLEVWELLALIHANSGCEVPTLTFLQFRNTTLKVRAIPLVFYLAKFSLMISKPTETSSLQPDVVVLPVSSWTISSRHKFRVSFVSVEPAAAENADTGAGRHQMTELSPIPKLRPASCARFSGEAVDSNMMRKLLCTSGRGRLPVSRGSLFCTNK